MVFYFLVVVVSITSSTGQISFYPNITDDHFHPSMVALFEQDETEKTRYYTVKLSVLEPNCTGKVVAIQYCYWRRQEMTVSSIFDIIFGKRESYSFMTNKTITIIPDEHNERKYVLEDGEVEILCGNYSRKNMSLFHLSSRKFDYGIKLLGHQLLLKKTTAIWYEAGNQNNIYKN